MNAAHAVFLQRYSGGDKTLSFSRGTKLVNIFRWERTFRFGGRGSRHILCCGTLLIGRLWLALGFVYRTAAASLSVTDASSCSGVLGMVDRL